MNFKKKAIHSSIPSFIISSKDTVTGQAKALDREESREQKASDLQTSNYPWLLVNWIL